MSVSRETMTDEQRKSVALEYLKAFDQCRRHVERRFILDLFAEHTQVFFPNGAGRRARIRSGDSSPISVR